MTIRIHSRHKEKACLPRGRHAFEVNGSLRCCDYGPPGQPFWVFYSYLPTFGNTKFGKILIGPAPIFQLFPLLSYPGPDGIHSITLTVPDDPILDYVTIYWQSLDITQFGPVKGKLTNGQSTLIDPD